MNNGQPRSHSIIDKKISGKIQVNTSNQKYIFPALNVSNNFATLDYDAQKIKKQSLHNKSGIQINESTSM